MNKQNKQHYSQQWSQDLLDINTEAILYEHKVTGMQVLHFKNDDTNKLFGINFKTIPTDSTGIAHILEHSVLTGSKKYPLNDPFIELVKTSLKTYLNAFTYPDFTGYPVSSENEQDLANLMEVYLDAVFNPLLTKDILRQEGWRYELTDTQEKLVYQGVVFNEMKGSMSNVDSVLGHFIENSLFPENTCFNNSGGDPAQIPNLTHQQLLAFHKKYYHPSNALVFLYGDLDVDLALEHLQGFLKPYSKCEIGEKINSQKAFNKVRVVQKSYAVTEQNGKKDIAVCGWAFNDKMAIEDRWGWEILQYLLLDSDASPLRKALLESGFGEGIISEGYDDDYLQPIFVTGMKDVTRGQVKNVQKLVIKTLTEISKKIDKSLIAGALNTIEFSLREQSMGGSGIPYMVTCVHNWLYQRENILEKINFTKYINNLKQRLATGELYFENLIKKYLLKNTHQVHLEITADENLEAKVISIEEKKLAKFRASLNESEINDLIKTTKKFIKWQQRPNSPVLLAQLPRLKLADMEQKIRKFPIKTISLPYSGTLLHSDYQTNDIVYINFAFEMSHLTPEQLTYVSFFTQAILRMGTKHKSYTEVSILLDKLIGGVGSSVFNDVTTIDKKAIVKLEFSLKCLKEFLKPALKLFTEMLTEVNFDQPDRFKQILLETKVAKSNALISSGHAYAFKRAMAQIHSSGQRSEYLSGIDQYQKIQEMSKNFSQMWPTILNNLQELQKILIVQNQTIIHVTTSAKIAPSIILELKKTLSILPLRKTSLVPWKPKQSVRMCEAFPIASPINYVAEATDLSAIKHIIHGSSTVIIKLLRTGYLWSKVRVEGGAYGSMISYDSIKNTLGLVSYRDPNINKTLQIYHQIGEHLTTIKMDQAEIEGAVIGSIGNVDTYLLPYKKGVVGLHLYLLKMSNDYRQKRRDELLATNIEDLKRFGKMLQTVTLTDKIQVVVGNAKAIKKAQATTNFQITKL